MIAKPLLVQHMHKGKLVRSKMLRKASRPFVIGSSRLADIIVKIDSISGVHSVLEYRHPHWFLVNCSMAEDLDAEKKILGGETIEIGDHTIKLLLGEEHEDIFEKENLAKKANAHQVVIYSNNEVLETHMLGKEEEYELNLGTVVKTFPPPADYDWKETKIGRFKIKQRLTFKPDQLPSEKTYLSLVNDEGIRKGLVGGFCFFMIILTLQFVLKTEKEEVPDDKFVDMIYNSKVVKQMQADAQKLVKDDFKQIKKDIDTSPVPKQELATTVIKNIKKAGLSDLVAKIAKRASENSVKIQALGKVADNPDTSRALASIGGSKKIAEKTDLKGKNHKLAKVKTAGKSGGDKNYKDGASLSAKGVGTANVDIIEEETIIDGGLDKEIIAAYIKSKLGQIRYCYERRLSANPDLHGKVLVRFTISGSGKVSAKSIAKTSLKDANVEACILRRVASWKFPEPKGGTSVIVSYPFLFKSIN